MEVSPGTFGQLAATSKDLALRLLVVGENRLELLAVEVQQERERLIRILLLALAVAVVGLLAGLTLTASIVLFLPGFSPAVVLLVLTALYVIAGICLYRRLMAVLRQWDMLSASLEQLRKDRECLEKILA